MARRRAPWLTSPPDWSNPKTILFHGTIERVVPSILAAVDVMRGLRYRDFGRGFYTTTLERQARTWAGELAERYPGSSPTVIAFELDRDALAELDVLSFVRGSYDAEDFWSFVFHCRRGGRAHGRKPNGGWYDVVVGPVCAAWRQRLCLHDADQISFHSKRAARLLNIGNPRRIP